jgi:glutaminyl-peptide cyclotransferase
MLHLRLLTIWALLAVSACGRQTPPPPAFDGGKAMAYVERQCAFGPRVPGTPAHRACRDFLVGELRRFGGEPTLQSFEADPTVYGEALTLHNIRAGFGRGERRRLLIGAHYDSRPRADQDPDPANRQRPVPGANDGASGVSVLLVLAELLGSHDFPVGVDLVLFDGEDGGHPDRVPSYCLGSQHFVRNRGSYEPYGMILLDMVGEKDLQIRREVYSQRGAPALLEALYAEARDLGFAGTFVPGVGPVLIDDHVPFLEAGIPAVDLVDFDYLYWHTVEDTPDKCSARSLEAVGRVLTSFLWKGAPFGPPL